MPDTNTSGRDMIISGERRIGYGEIQARIRRAVSGFRALGLVDSAPIAMMLRNDFALFEVVAASSRPRKSAIS
jgi:long-chain acyl-CoA synthetase